MNFINIEDLENLALGAAILGSGGGGAPSYNRLITQHMIEQCGPVRLLKVDDLSPDDLVVPVGFMGAPLVGLEKIASGREFSTNLRALERYVGRKPTVLMSAEIGGGNAFVSLWVGAMLNLPVLDADLIGRAFPELQMSSCTISGVPAAPAFLADALGNHVIIEASSVHTIERMARQLSVAMGSRAAVALSLMNGVQAKQSVVAGSVTRAIAIGRALATARTKKENPTEAVLKEVAGFKLTSATVVDVDHKIAGGFLKGTASLMPDDGGEPVLLLYQNEYLLASRGERVLATTPDLLMLLERGTGTPVTSDALRYGLRVDLIAFSPPDIWQTEKGLELVGPRYFGYKVDYNPIGRNI